MNNIVLLTRYLLFRESKLPVILTVALVLSSFFLEKNEAKKASWLSNRFAFKGVRHDKAH